jgi:hypothetical protein
VVYFLIRRCSKYLVGFIEVWFALGHVLPNRFQGIHHLSLLVRRQMDDFPVLRRNLAFLVVEIGRPGRELR